LKVNRENKPKTPIAVEGKVVNPTQKNVRRNRVGGQDTQEMLGP